MKKLKIFGYLLLTSFLIWGCEDWIADVAPPTSIPGEAVLGSEEGVRALRASMYSKMRASFWFTTDYFIGPGAMADETRNRPGSTRYQGYNQAVSGDGSTVHLGSWAATYNVIQDANLLAGAIQPGVLDDQTLDRFRGEALAIRAFAMHHAVRVFGYEPGMIVGGWDRGIIIRTEPTIDLEDADFRARATVDQVYTQIFDDLAEAANLLAGISDAGDGHTRATESFVYGVKARAHLYAGNWQQAADAALEAINRSTRSLETTADGIAVMFHENEGAVHPEALFRLEVNPATEATTGGNTFINNGPAAYTSTQWVAQVPTQMVIDLYDPDDYRLGWYEECFNHEAGTPMPGCTAVNAPGWSVTKFNGRRGQTVDDMPYMRLAEMYLIRAEALAKAAGIAAGIPALNELRVARNTAPVAAGDFANITEFEDEILRERIRELIAEGHRYYDLKRLGRDIENPDGSPKIGYNTHRILAPIGASHVGVNPLLEENPGY